MSEAPQPVHDLVARFQENLDAYRSQRYNEAQVRAEFIDPFFQALGWDVHNRAGHAEAYIDVIREDAIKVRGAVRLDISPRFGPRDTSALNHNGTTSATNGHFPPSTPHNQTQLQRQIAATDRRRNNFCLQSARINPQGKKARFLPATESSDARFLEQNEQITLKYSHVEGIILSFCVSLPQQ